MVIIRRQAKVVPDASLDALLAAFEDGTSVVENQGLRFDRFPSVIELERILPDAFEADSALTTRELRQVLRKSLRACRIDGSLTADKILAEAHRIAKDKLSVPPQRFSLWTKFRARQMAFAENFHLEWDGVSLESTHCLPQHMVLEEYFLNGHGRIFPDKPRFYGYLVAHCDARTAETAVSRILDAVDLFMAVFNMYALPRWSAHSEHRLDATLLPGPHQFVFQGETFLSDTLWFDPDFSEEAWDTFSPDMNAVVQDIPVAREALSKLVDHPIRNALVNTLRLMQGAMSSRNPSYRLLRYWSALEQLYGEPSSHEKRYPNIIERASFAEPDKLIAKWKLEHLSRLRNEYVHAGESEDELQAMSQYLRDLLVRHIHYLLHDASDIRDHLHWLEIVDLPDDLDVLEKRKAAIDRRIALIRGAKGD